MKFKRRCYLVYGVAPSSLNAKQANHALNAWIKNETLGKIIYHEHFVNRPLGGIAVFEVVSHTELEHLIQEPQHEDSYLHGWNLNYHPMLHSTSTDKFVYQTQYTLSTYRGVKMTFEIND